MAERAQLPPALLTRLATALHSEDPERGLAELLTALGEVGIAELKQAGSRAWLSVELGERKVSLVAREDPSEDVRDLVEALLRTALLRALERERMLRATERATMLSEASFEGIMVHIDGTIIDANQRLADLLGYAPEELVGANTMRVCVAPEDMPDVLRRLREHVEGEYVITGIRKDGTRFRAELHSKQGKFGERPVRVVAVRDVTERERTQALLRDSEAQLRRLLEAAFEVTVSSRDGIIIDVGGKLREVFGYEREDLVGRRVLDFVAPASVPMARAHINKRLEGAYQSLIVDKGGVSVPVEVVGVVSSVGGEPVRIAGLRDLRPLQRLESERRELEQQLEQSQRMDSLGVLAGGIAHDFHNLLTGVIGNASLLLERVKQGEEHETVQAILAAGERAATLTRQMLAYAGRRQGGTHEIVDLQALLNELGPLLQASLSKKATLKFDLSPGSAVLGDRTALMQVFMNLLTNASDALEGKAGTIDVRTRRITVPDERWRRALGATVGPGDWLLTEVGDTGAGMDEATMQRIFEPFFSTKEAGHGLGLAAAVGIVRSHGGALLVESTRGSGSCFSVLLPAAGSAAPSAGRNREPETLATPCRVLVIDDEALVRGVVRRTLELRGYAVVEAADGRAGLELFERTKPDVVLVDLTMPEMDGVEVIQRLRATGSEVPIVLSSGYLGGAPEQPLAPGSFQALLNKPYAASELVAAVEKARRG